MQINIKIILNMTNDFCIIVTNHLVMENLSVSPIWGSHDYQDRNMKEGQGYLCLLYTQRNQKICACHFSHLCGRQEPVVY